MSRTQFTLLKIIENQMQGLGGGDYNLLFFYTSPSTKPFGIVKSERSVSKGRSFTA